MWSMIPLMTSRLPGGHPCLRAGDQKSSATNSRQSAGRHYRQYAATGEMTIMGRLLYFCSGLQPGASILGGNDARCVIEILGWTD